MIKIALIRGDGVGPEIVSVALEVLDAVGFDANYVEVDVGYERWKREGVAVTDEDIEVVKECEIVLKGPVITPPEKRGFSSVNVALRKALDLYANVRPAKALPITRPIFKGIDIIVVRENLEGLYSGRERGEGGVAVTERLITERESRRVAEYTFKLATKEGRKRVTCVHKANILKQTDGLFKEVVYDVARRYGEIRADDVIVDACAFKLVVNPQQFDVLLTPNLYGDILSDLVGGLVGSLGLLGSYNVGDRYALFEPVHGAVLGKAGKGTANPTGMLIATSYMLKHVDETKKAFAIQRAVESVLEDRSALTIDLGGSANTRLFTNAVMERLP